MDDARPDEAICYFRRTVNYSPTDEDGRLGLGTSLLIVGDTEAGRKELAWLTEKGKDDQKRETARDWLSLLGNPLPIAILYLPEQHCSADFDAGPHAATSLRRTLGKLGAVKVTKVESSRGRGDGLTLASAGLAGARAVVVLEVSCGRMTTTQNPTLLGGMVQLSGLTVYHSEVALKLELYQASTGERQSVLDTYAEKSNVTPKAAVLAATDSAVGKAVLKLSNRLLFGGRP